jgi:DNA-binding PadR family transcriptional regulator
LTVLGLLEVGPLHPYGLQQLIKAWGKDQVVNVGNRANLYKTIRRLTDAGLIAVRTTERDQLYPERTVYELTEAGRQESVRWLEVMLATARNEFPEFPAALSFAMLLPPPVVEAALRRRADQVRANLEKLDEALQGLGRDPAPRHPDRDRVPKGGRRGRVGLAGGHRRRAGQRLARLV